MSEQTNTPPKHDPTKDYAEFEMGKHRVPWFLWVFFVFIASWAFISWYKFFGY